MAKILVETKLRAIGNSQGIILPTEIIKELAIKKGDKLFLVKDDKGYSITTYNQEFKQQLEAAELGMQNYRNTLKELAQ